MIMGDSTTHGGLAFQPSHAVPSAANEQDGDKGGADELKYLDNPPIDPTTLTVVVSSVITTVSTVVTSQLPTSSSFPTVLPPISDMMDIYSTLDMINHPLPPSSMLMSSASNHYKWKVFPSYHTFPTTMTTPSVETEYREMLFRLETERSA